MIKRISKIIYSYMSKRIKVDAKLEEVYKYGIEITISSGLNILLVLAVSVLLQDPLSGLSFLVCLILLRSFCGGYHANSYFKCNSLMVILFVIAYFIGSLVIRFNFADYHFRVVVILIAFLPIYMFAPVKNKYKVLSKRKARKCRAVSIIIYIFLSLLGLFLTSISILHFYGSIIIITLVEISVLILIEIFIQRRRGDEISENGC